jgi:hypothetical protein
MRRLLERHAKQPVDSDRKISPHKKFELESKFSQSLKHPKKFTQNLKTQEAPQFKQSHVKARRSLGGFNFLDINSER